MKLNCSATLIAALLTAISVFCANLAHTEVKSQLRKRKSRRNVDVTLTTTKDTRVSEVKNVELV